jgi:zinc transporter ZupT
MTYLSALPLLFVAITFFSTLAGGLFVLKNRRLKIEYFFAFAAGALIGVSFFDLFPEIIGTVNALGTNATLIMSIIVVSFFFFHILDRLLVIHSMKMHRSSVARNRMLQINGMARATGLSIHSFFDGVAIGAAFHISTSFGFVIGLAVIFHDFSDGLNTVTIMRRSGSGYRISLGWLLVDSLTPLLGALSTFLFTLGMGTIAMLLAFFVGEFLFIGMADMLPEAHSKGTSYKVVLASILGVLLIFIVTRFLNI